MKTFYGYQLTLSFYENGETVKDYSSGSAPVDFVASFSSYTDTNVLFKREGSAQYTQYGLMNLYSLNYQKQLYRPNCIKASIECSADLKSSMVLLAGFFKDAKAKLEVVAYNETADSSGNKSINIDKGVTAKLIADKYEVYESSPRYDKSQRKMYIDLVMYSPDKALDTFEYSKAYTNKRLGLDIFRPEAEAISPSLETECENMQVLRLVTGDEFIQPYLVQYNETFYSFMARVANRCGEFLYYEDTNHKLNLGTKPAEREEMLLPTPGQEKMIKYKFSDSDFDKISFTDFSTSHNHENDSEDFYNNYMVKEAQNPTKSFVRNSELSGNEYFETVEKGKFSNADDERKYEAYGFFHTVGKLFTNTMGAGLFLAAVNLVKENAYDVSKKAEAVNDHFDKKFFSGESVSRKRLFGSEDSMIDYKKGIVNVNSAFYPLVRDKELACNRGRVSLQVSSDISKDVMLGDRINFFGKEYIVIEVTASFDVIVNSNGSTAIRQPISVVAIPVDITPMPTSSVEPIRKVGCQKAFVTDVDDPSFLGRVRVRFSWQGNDADASPWIRACSQMANSNGGTAFFKAAVGDSVLIDFENGNADMPYVAGFLPVMSQQQNKGQFLSRHNSVVLSSEHGQMMLMSDPPSGNNTLGWEALPSMVGPLGAFVPGLPTYDESMPRFLGSTEFTDYYGSYSVKMSSTDRAVTINSPFGTVSMNAFTGININAPQGDINIAGKNVKLTAYNNLSIESGVNAKPGSTRYYADLIFGAIADFVTDTVMPMFIDLSYLRNIIEIFIKPCEGTLSLKSGRYLIMQAGGADAKIPFTGFVIPKSGMVNFDPERDKVAALHNALNFIDGSIKTVNYLVSELKSAMKEVQKTWEKEFFIKNPLGDGNNLPIINDQHISLNMLVDRVNVPHGQAPAVFEVGDNFQLSEEYVAYMWEGIELMLPEGVHAHDREDLLGAEDQEAKLVRTANNMVKKLRNVRLSTGFKVVLNGPLKLKISDAEGDITPVVDKLMSTANLGVYTATISNNLKAVLRGDLAHFSVKDSKRVIAKAVLEYARDTEHVSGMCASNIDNLSDDKQWKQYVSTLFNGMSVGFWGQLGASALNAVKTVVDKLNPVQQLTGKWVQGGRKWSAERRGQILISDTEGTTMYFNNGTLKSFSNSDLYSVKTFCEKFL